MPVKVRVNKDFSIVNRYGGIHNLRGYILELEPYHDDPKFVSAKIPPVFDCKHHTCLIPKKSVISV